MRRVIYFLAMILTAVGPAALARAADAPSNAEHIARTFPRPAELEPQIAFWRAIFTRYSKHQVVLHDAVHLDKVYKILDFTPHVENGMSDGELAALERIETDLELERLRA